MRFVIVTVVFEAIGFSWGNMFTLVITCLVVSLMISYTGTHSIEFPSFVIVMLDNVVEVIVKGKILIVIVNGGEVVMVRLLDFPDHVLVFELQTKSNLLFLNEESEDTLKSKIPGATILEYKMISLVLFTPSMNISRLNTASVSVVS